MSDCLSCTFPEKHPDLVVYQSERWSVFHTFRFWPEGSLVLVPKVHGLFHEISAKDWKEAAPIIAGVSRMIMEIEKPDRTYVLSFGEENTHLHIMMVVRGPEHPAAYGGKLGLDLAYAIRSEKRELDAKLVAASVGRYQERVAEYIKRASA